MFNVHVWLSLACFLLSVIFYALARQEVRQLSAQSKPQREVLLQHTQQWWNHSKQNHHKNLSNIIIAMRQAGYISNRQQILCLLKVLVVWGSLVLIFSGQQLLTSDSMLKTILYCLLFITFGFWASIRWFRIQAQKRARIIDEEMLITIHLMSILWQVGLSLESMLRAYHQEAKDLTPEICKEISLILARIDAGQNREWVFRDMATLSLSIGFQDLLTMLSQAADTGGELKKSFQSLSELIYERKRVALQEKVTKMSGKISVTMMVLMFPALFIILGGPAALALMKAFGG
ncbi:type II secretion system F family protein [Vibrio cincinnatiensis]|jgi:tight adherence protein C|uniref:Tight adherence protein C n=1 Tax=Vibrio cincinnatiensis DSM 19608 TaxID=1123491 RepID=A0A1T4L3W2_VIBCI|nr:type II secretion system F family protein [Vibrio cincinnatiensis]MCG3743664.1 type II secretion system F family protein [Vibrio cincinnatiensis]SJZ49406.1 tight adherence protein C [Vibrio cincinnatiensis DSM 19608]SUP48228.1 tight adherence TadC-like transmembrane protein [Vibrio cincinnatiensis]